LVVSLAVAIISFASLGFLNVDISGDSVPNRSQGGGSGLPVEYQWNLAIPILFIAILSTGTAAYSWKQLNRRR
jgi:hypothetical protein